MADPKEQTFGQRFDELRKKYSLDVLTKTMAEDGYSSDDYDLPLSVAAQRAQQRKLKKSQPAQPALTVDTFVGPPVPTKQPKPPVEPVEDVAPVGLSEEAVPETAQTTPEGVSKFKQLAKPGYEFRGGVLNDPAEQAKAAAGLAVGLGKTIGKAHISALAPEGLAQEYGLTDEDKAEIEAEERGKPGF